MATNPQLWPPLAEVGSRSSRCLEEEENCIIMVADGNADQLPVPGEQGDHQQRMGAGTSWVHQLCSANDNPSQCVPLISLIWVPPSDGLKVPRGFFHSMVQAMALLSVGVLQFCSFQLPGALHISSVSKRTTLSLQHATWF